MARPSKLTVAQCGRICALKNNPEHPVSVPKLAKRFKVSESSVYKVLDGTYIARPDVPVPQVPRKVPSTPTPSIFTNASASRRKEDNDLAQILEQAAKCGFDEPIDDLTLAAAELVMARSRFTKALSSAH